MLDGLHKIHFIGIGGAGMSALAFILLDEGYEVSGSDIKDSPMAEKLRAHGAKVYIGHRAENVDGGDAIVVSSAIHEDNPEVIAAHEAGIKRLHRSDVNAALLNRVKGIAVAGAHGKTTTTSMIGLILTEGHLDPTIIIGGEVDYLGGNSRLGKGEYLVSEADESDGSFLKLRPHIAVVTNVEDDHLDHYGTMNNIRKAFKEFIENVDKETGYAVLCFDNENIRGIAKNVDRRIVSYAIDHDADYMAKNIVTDGAHTTFDVMHNGVKITSVELGVPGKHNVLNALASVVTGILCGLEPSVSAAGLADFHGAKRRFETKARVDGVWIVDDYAHHPTEIQATLRAAHQTNPKRLICVFQPHRYSRTKLLKDEFGIAFQEADMLIVTDIYSAGEAPIEGISGETIFDAVVEATGQNVTYIEKREDIAPYLATIAEEGDLIMTMGAGDIYKTGVELADMLKNREK